MKSLEEVRKETYEKLVHYGYSEEKAKETVNRFAKVISPSRVLAKTDKFEMIEIYL